MEQTINMITYELAKQLKEAGYEAPYARMEQYYPDVNVPTLSELIEACGDRDGIVIWRFNGIWRAGQAEKWGGRNIYGEVEPLLTGSTPEESVALLWLELNKKH